MEDKSFWFRICIVVAVCVSIIIIGPISCTMYESKLLTNMVEHGENPIEARCALGTNSATLCELYFANKR